MGDGKKRPAEDDPSCSRLPHTKLARKGGIRASGLVNDKSRPAEDDASSDIAVCGDINELTWEDERGIFQDMTFRFGDDIRQWQFWKIWGGNDRKCGGKLVSIDASAHYLIINCINRTQPAVQGRIEGYSNDKTPPVTCFAVPPTWISDCIEQGRFIPPEEWNERYAAKHEDGWVERPLPKDDEERRAWLLDLMSKKTWRSKTDMFTLARDRDFIGVAAFVKRNSEYFSSHCAKFATVFKTSPPQRSHDQPTSTTSFTENVISSEPSLPTQTKNDPPLPILTDHTPPNVILGTPVDPLLYLLKVAEQQGQV